MQQLNNEILFFKRRVDTVSEGPLPFRQVPVGLRVRELRRFKEKLAIIICLPKEQCWEKWHGPSIVYSHSSRAIPFPRLGALQWDCHSFPTPNGLGEASLHCLAWLGTLG